MQLAGIHGTTADAQDAHGVIAFGETDQGKGVAYGFAWNFHGKDAAYAEAVKACISSGGTGCVQLAWFQNGCGALAIDQYGNGAGKPGMSSEQAEARAVRTCEATGGSGCNVVGSVCAAPGGEPGTWSGSESVLTAPGSQATATEPEDESLTREDGYNQLAGKTYEMTDSDHKSIIEIMRFGRDGQTDYMIRTCFGDSYCKGATKVEGGMIESNITCEGGAWILKFSLEGIQDSEQFTTTVSYGDNPKDHIDVDFVEIEDLSQATKLGCQRNS